MARRIRSLCVSASILTLAFVGMTQVSRSSPLLSRGEADRILGGAAASTSCNYTWSASHLCSRTDACRNQYGQNCGSASCDGICEFVRQYYDTRTTWPWESDYQKGPIVCGRRKTGATCIRIGNATSGYSCDCDGGTLQNDNPCADQETILFGTCDGA